VIHFFMGVVGMGFAVAALFFVRFWLRTQDRLFAFFAVAFTILAVNRAGLVMVASDFRSDHLYWVRFLAFAMILGGIVDKNRSQKRSDA
jgi:hypothetical protein